MVAILDTRHDRYPSRTSEPMESFGRLDPVVHGSADSGPLDAGLLAEYERNGFLYFDGFFNSEEVEQFTRELRRLCNDAALKDEEGVITEPDSNEIRSIFAVHKRSSLFDRLSRHPRLLGIARQLLGGDVYIHQSRINYKPGFHGKGFDWHSDFETWHAEDGVPSMRAVSCSIILTENNEFNGPLMLIPGSHRTFVPCLGETPEENFRSSLKKQEAGVPDTESLARLVHDAGGIQAPKGPAGGVLFFECNTLHGSNANMSPYPRSNVFFVYNSVKNVPREPYAAENPRPAFLAERRDFRPLTPDTV